METIFGSARQVTATDTPLPTVPAKPKSVGLALGLSLLWPGLGHFYCGKKSAGAWTAALFGIALLAVIFNKPSESPLWWGFCLRGAVILYMFGFTDAYFLALEHNAGVSSFVLGSNPRVAATLNLLGGWGYFYLGERSKGIFWFFAIRVVGAVFQQFPRQPRLWGSAMLEVLLAVVAVDAYIVARNQLRASVPEYDSIARNHSAGLQPLVPAVLACFFGANYILLVAIGLTVPDYKEIDQSRKVISTTPGGSVYSNPVYNVRVSVPEGWNFDLKNPRYIMEANGLEGGCRVGLLPVASIPVRSLRSEAQALVNTITKDKSNFQWLSEKPVSLAGNGAYEVKMAARFSHVEVIQHYVLMRHRLTMYNLIETMNSALADQCEPQLRSIRNQIVIDGDHAGPTATPSTKPSPDAESPDHASLGYPTWGSAPATILASIPAPCATPAAEFCPRDFAEWR